MRLPYNLKALEECINRQSTESVSTSISIQPASDIHYLKIPFDIQIVRQERDQIPGCVGYSSVGSSFSVGNTLDYLRSRFHEISNDSLNGCFPRNSSRFHRHNYFEMMYVLQGTVEQFIEGGRFIHTQGSLCLMNCYTEHAEMNLHDFTAVFLCLSKEYVSQNILPYLPAGSPLGDFFHANILNEHGGQKDFIRFDPQRGETEDLAENLLNYITREFILKEAGYQQLINGTILRLLANLQSSGKYTQEYFRLDSTTESEIFSKVTKIMEKRNLPVSRGELVQALSYNGDYINRVVKKFSGMTIVQYNRSIQIKKAANLLCQTDAPIAEIIHYLGYESRSHFYKAFQSRYKMSPSQFRANHSSQTYRKAQSGNP